MSQQDVCRFSEEIDNEYSYQFLGTTYDHIIDKWSQIMNTIISKQKRYSLKALTEHKVKSTKTSCVSFLEDLFGQSFSIIPNIQLNLKRKIIEEYRIPKNVVLKEDWMQIEKPQEIVSDKEIELLIAKLADVNGLEISYQKMTDNLTDLKQQQKSLLKKLNEQHLKPLNKNSYADDMFKDLIGQIESI